MTALLVVSDVHWSDNPIDYYRHEFVKYIVDWIHEYNVEMVLLLGDLTDQKDRHGAWLVNQVVFNVVTIAGACPVVILQGNHDSVVESTPFFEFLSLIGSKRIVWINKPEMMQLPVINEWALFLPHTRNYEKDWADIHITDYPYVFTHNTFAGTRTETGHEVDGIPLSIFAEDQVVISGDIHVPQKLGPLTYVGAPYSIDFGDEFNGRCLLLNRRGKKKVLRNPGPRKKVVDLIPSDLPGVDRNLRVNDIVKVRLHIPADEYYDKFHEYRQQIIEYYSGKYKVSKVQPIIEGSIVEKGTSRVIEHRSDKRTLEEYAKTRGVDRRVVKVGKRLLKQG